MTRCADACACEHCEARRAAELAGQSLNAWSENALRRAAGER